MPEGQKKIYYVTAESAAHAKNLPQVEPVTEKGYDVLVFTDEIDTFVTNTLRNYNEKEFCNVTSDDLGIESEDEKKEAEKKDEEFKTVVDFAKETLGDAVKAVKISHKLKNHAVLLSTQGGITFEMEKYFKEMPGSGEGPGIKAERVLELNSEADAFKSLQNAIENDKERAAKIVKVMYGQACLMAGQPLDDPVEYSDLVLSMM
jgi:molecular chaperone HtpG